VSGSAGLYAALRRFPEKHALVKSIFVRDESFRTICEDLAAAQSALSAVDRLAEHVRPARRAEYEELVQSLIGEIERVLHQTKIVPIA
jgi:hypothetical protein